MEPLDRLLAIEDIRQLKARYFRLVDTQQWDKFRELFTDDAVFKVDFFTSNPVDGAGSAAHTGSEEMTARFGDSGTLVTSGADAIVEMVRSRLTGIATVHSGPNAEIEIVSGNEATGIWNMRDILRTPEGVLGGYGHYHERYRKVAGRWRIAESHVTRQLMSQEIGDFA